MYIMWSSLYLLFLGYSLYFQEFILSTKSELAVMQHNFDALHEVNKLISRLYIHQNKNVMLVFLAFFQIIGRISSIPLQYTVHQMCANVTDIFTDNLTSPDVDSFNRPCVPAQISSYVSCRGVGNVTCDTASVSSVLPPFTSPEYNSDVNVLNVEPLAVSSTMSCSFEHVKLSQIIDSSSASIDIQSSTEQFCDYTDPNKPIILSPGRLESDHLLGSSSCSKSTPGITDDKQCEQLKSGPPVSSLIVLLERWHSSGKGPEPGT